MTTTTSETPPTDPIFCLKCKEKTESRDAEHTTTRNGRPAVKAVCADCGTKKCRIGK